MISWKEPPTGKSLLLLLLCAAAGPLLLRGLLRLDLGSLETLLFGISTSGNSGPMGLFPGELASSLEDGLAALRENLFLLVACWAQPAQVLLHLAEVESPWFNPTTAVPGVLLLLLPLASTGEAVVRNAPLSSPTRALLLLLSAAVGVATCLPQGGAMVIAAALLLPPFLFFAHKELTQRAARQWLPSLLCWGYLLALVVDLGIGWWLVGQA